MHKWTFLNYNDYIDSHGLKWFMHNYVGSKGGHGLINMVLC